MLVSGSPYHSSAAAMGPIHRELSAAQQLSAAERRVVSFEKRVGFLCFSLHVLTQITHLSCPWNERWQRLVSIPVAGLPSLCLFLSPPLYMKWRTPLLLGNKLIFFAFPLLRQPRGIQRVLDAPATPGAVGFFVDTLKIAWGSRIIAVLVSGLSTRLDVLPHVLIQIYSLLMVRNNSSLCSAPLMTDPLTLERMRAFNTASCGSLLPPLGVLGAGWALPQRGDCSLFLTLLHVVIGVLAPTAVVVLAADDSGRRDGARWFSVAGRQGTASQRLLMWWLLLGVAWAAALLATPLFERG